MKLRAPPVNQLRASLPQSSHRCRPPHPIRAFPCLESHQTRPDGAAPSCASWPRHRACHAEQLLALPRHSCALASCRALSCLPRRAASLASTAMLRLLAQSPRQLPEPTQLSLALSTVSHPRIGHRSGGNAAHMHQRSSQPVGLVLIKPRASSLFKACPNVHCSSSLTRCLHR
jgi:hypothetical protein